MTLESNLKHSFHREEGKKCIMSSESTSTSFTTWMKKKKKNQSCTSLCSPRSISQHGWRLFFRLQCQKNTSSTAPPGPAYPLESLWELHLFTNAFAWKLYKHRCTIKRGSYVTDVSPCCGPNVTIFTALSLKSSHPPIRSCRGRTVTYTIHIHTYIPSAFNSRLLTSAPITKCKGHNCAAWRAPFTRLTRLMHNMWWYCNSSDSWGNWWN